MFSSSLVARMLCLFTVLHPPLFWLALDPFDISPNFFSHFSPQYRACSVKFLTFFFLLD